METMSQGYDRPHLSRSRDMARMLAGGEAPDVAVPLSSYPPPWADGDGREPARNGAVIALRRISERVLASAAAGSGFGALTADRLFHLTTRRKEGRVSSVSVRASFGRDQMLRGAKARFVLALGFDEHEALNAACVLTDEVERPSETIAIGGMEFLRAQASTDPRNRANVLVSWTASFRAPREIELFEADVSMRMERFAWEVVAGRPIALTDPGSGATAEHHVSLPSRRPAPAR